MKSALIAGGLIAVAATAGGIIYARSKEPEALKNNYGFEARGAEVRHQELRGNSTNPTWTLHGHLYHDGKVMEGYPIYSYRNINGDVSVRDAGVTDSMGHFHIQFSTSAEEFEAGPLVYTPDGQHEVLLYLVKVEKVDGFE